MVLASGLQLRIGEVGRLKRSMSVNMRQRSATLGGRAAAARPSRPAKDATPSPTATTATALATARKSWASGDTWAGLAPDPAGMAALAPETVPATAAAAAEGRTSIPRVDRPAEDAANATAATGAAAESSASGGPARKGDFRDFPLASQKWYMRAMSEGDATKVRGARLQQCLAVVRSHVPLSPSSCWKRPWKVASWS
jgi:hypothetical protein